MSIGAMLLSMAGGLGLFLFGMRLMSESIEKAAGAKLRGILEMFTKNRFVGMLVGTTVTSQLVSFNLSEIAPVFLLAGILGIMFCKRQNIVKICHIILGFGVLFMGLSGMSSAMSGMRDMPEIVHILSSLTSPMLAILVGTLLTAVIQSSSVTVSIVLLMANHP